MGCDGENQVWLGHFKCEMSSRYLSGVTEYAIRPVGWWERSGLEIKTLWFHQDSNKRVNVFPGRGPLMHYFDIEGAYSF